MKLQSADIERLVTEHHPKLYRFAMSLARNEAEACDLTQQTYFKLASKGGQIQDIGKAKSWLFTTLYREFLAMRRQSQRYVSLEGDDEAISSLSVPADAASFDSAAVRSADAAIVIAALDQVRELYRAPLALFYIDDLSYQDIAGILDIPIGTVMSRLSRGKEELRGLLADSFRTTAEASNVIPLRRKSNE